MYTLPPLRYSFDALEPYIDRATMEIHYTKHHQAYIDNANKILLACPELQIMEVETILKDISVVPAKFQEAFKNNGGGYLNHTLFWDIMKPYGGGLPKDGLQDALVKKFGSFQQFQELFNDAAKSRFGSGWAWLVLNTEKELMIYSTANQDSPIMHSYIPIMGLDVWEHAYYLKYQNRRVDYISAWWNVLDWDLIEERYRFYKK